MIGKLDVEEDIMDDSLIAKRKAAAVMKTVHEQLQTPLELGWDYYDNAVEIVALQSMRLKVLEPSGHQLKRRS